jgi:hypothetical protein
LFLILGQVEEAQLKEAQLRNELKAHNIDMPTTQQVQLLKIFKIKFNHLCFIRNATDNIVLGYKYVCAL